MSETLSWAEQNRSYLAAELGLLAVRLGPGPSEDGHETGTSEEGGETRMAAELVELRASMAPPPALDRLAEVFGLSPFERSILLLCAGVELDGEVAARCASAVDRESLAPTFGLALSRLPDPHWSALSPGGPLRSWRLLELSEGGLLTRRKLSIDERILHYLVGVQHLDERLLPLLDPVPPPGPLVPSHRDLVRAAASALQLGGEEGILPALLLVGSDPASKLAIASAVATGFGWDLASMRASVIPTTPAELEGLVRLWRREAMLAGRALFLDCDDLEDGESPLASAVARFIDSLGGVLFVSCRRRRRERHRPLATFEVGKPSSPEQRQLWQLALGGRAEDLNGHLDRLVGQFRLEPGALSSSARRALATVSADGASPEELAPALWAACRRQGRPRLDHLAQRIVARVSWEDLVLAAEPKQALRDLAVQVRQRMTVHERWGFAARGSRGLGITSLFAGVSGTGKTLAAEVLANELGLDLYRIDLAAVISKYIGETEKNLGQVFDAAEGGGVVLLFDEADALFGKRSEVKDSHDRYANVEISYLLQRMEAYQGLAILTTNMKSALDQAFLRRLRFVVEFAFPGPEERAEIWSRVFPPETPTRGLDPAKLARLNVAGGNIKNIAINAAFAAAEQARPVGMEHLLKAARAEYRKLEKPLSESEIRGWLP